MIYNSGSIAYIQITFECMSTLHWPTGREQQYTCTLQLIIIAIHTIFGEWECVLLYLPVCRESSLDDRACQQSLKNPMQRFARYIQRISTIRTQHA